MPGMIGAFCDESQYTGREDLLGTIDVNRLSKTEKIELAGGFFASASLVRAPLKGHRCFEDDIFAVCLAGDLVGVESVPLDMILGAFRSGDYGALSKLRGNFAIAALNKADRRLFVAVDTRGQQPLFYRADGKGIVFSTDMSTFCKLTRIPPFDIKWLYEILFFNFPVSQVTFLEGVHRLPEGSMLIYDIPEARISIVSYVERFRRSEKLLKGKAALERAREVFGETFPRYFNGSDGQIAAGLTGGWDARLVLSYCPKELRDQVQTFTYGIEGCDDMNEAEKIAAAVNVKHLKICFDDDFLAQLPGLLSAAVRLSSGSLSILRSPLLHTYRTVTQGGRSNPMVLTGISGDLLFRGHCNVPAIMPVSMDCILSTGEPVINDEVFREILGHRYEDFAAYIHSVLEEIRALYGGFETSEHHLSYFVYKVAPRYFEGEMAIANQFSTFRVAYWDDDIIRLAHEIEPSTLKFSRFLPSGPDVCEENKLQAFLLSNREDFRNLPVAGIPLSVVAKGKVAWNLYRVWKHGTGLLSNASRRQSVPATNWRHWMTSILRETVDDLAFSPQSLVRGYLTPEYLARQEGAREAQWIGKICTTEVVLRALGDGWRMG